MKDTYPHTNEPSAKKAQMKCSRTTAFDITTMIFSAVLCESMGAATD
jgi:hypothetical protein